MGWSMARVEAIQKWPLRYYRCLELGHVRVTCGSTVDRGQLCNRCGGIGHQAKSCSASVPKCPLCETLGAPATDRMGGSAFVPPETKGRSRIREPATDSRQGDNVRDLPISRRGKNHVVGRWLGGGHGYGLGKVDSCDSSRPTWGDRSGSGSRVLSHQSSGRSPWRF